MDDGINSKTIIEPLSYSDIQNYKDSKEWKEAIELELNNMKSHNVYEFVKELPPNTNVVNSRWVFKYKHDNEGKIIKRKARLVAKGFTQQYGIDFKETFSPTLRQDSLRILIALAINKNFEIRQIDVNAAYLNATLNETIYMNIPQGHQDYKKGFWKLKKAIYGLKQAGREWNRTLNKILGKLKFTQLISEPCLYVKKNQTNKIICIIAVLVDDLIIAGIKKEIFNTINLIKRGAVGSLLYLVICTRPDILFGVTKAARKSTEPTLEDWKKSESKPVRCLKPIENKRLRQIKFNKTIYQSAIGSLLYLAINTRPDILFSVRIKFTRSTKIQIYPDADYAGDTTTRRSTSGFLIKIGDSPTSWYSKLQHCTSTSTSEAEYYGLGECAKQ
eukprot:jgi/Orpsp1_1/1185413/evm.model.c7180000093637.1